MTGVPTRRNPGLAATTWVAAGLLFFAFAWLATTPGGEAFAQSPPAAGQGTGEAGANGEGQDGARATGRSPDAPRDGAAISSEQLIFPDELASRVQQQSAEIERLVKAVERVRENESQLEALRPEIDAIIAGAQSTEEALKPRLQVVERQINELGERPKDGERAETTAIAEERQRLERLRSELQDAIKRGGLTRVRATQLLSYINRLRIENLGRNLVKREVSPLSPAHWAQFKTDLERVGRQVATITDNWWTIIAQRIDWLGLIVIGSALLWWSLRQVRRSMLMHWFPMPPTDTPPPYLARVSNAIGIFPIILAPGLVTAAVLYFAFDTATLFNDQIRTLAYAALQAIAIVMVTHAMAKAVLLPSHSSWRLIGLPDDRAQKYVLLITLIAGVYTFDYWFNEVAQSLHLPVSVVITENFLATVAFACLLFAIAWLPIPRNMTRASAQLVHKALQWLRLPATIAVVAIIVASAMGYLALGRFIAAQVMLFGIGATALLLGHLGARSLVEPTDQATAAMGADASASPQLARQRIWISTVAFLVNVGLILIAAVLLLLSWGYSSAELISWGRSLLFGFEVGGFRFSLIQVLIAIVLFIAVILLTRLVQRWLSQRVFNRETFDRGIANSVHAGIGYLGVALAALVGISYAGFDLSNLALIAGALSVGIGFGLIAIASNFISGLIMLFERPIKVGDWVVVGQHQGYVRHISVRATEIETFDRASVLVPNSDFMTSAVQNWTLRNAMGRIIINIGVAYHEDPERVLAILQNVAADCKVLLRSPAPTVVFENFGASSLDFSVRGYIADVNTTLSSATQLRIDIFKALRENDIEIPFPQQDIHLRDLDGVKHVFQRVAAERARKERDDQPASEPLSHGNDISGGNPGPGRE